MRLAALAGLLLFTACASEGVPPGSPPRLTPPAIILVSPDSGAILPAFSDDAVIQFDEVIDEMAQGSGGGGTGAVTGLAKQIVLSPVAGPVKVSWHRSAIHVKPKEGWQPGRIYHLQLLPGILDLHRNILKRGTTIIFSTGPKIPTASLRGMALSWVEQHTLTQGLIRAVLKPDTIAYLTYTDSTGRFRLDDVPPGQYVVYAVNDQNSNRVRDPREAFDSTLVTLDTSATATLWTFVHDTTGPRIKQSDPIDSLSFRITFTAPLATTGLPDTTTVRVLELPDSTPVAVARVLLPAANDSLVARERAVTDSLRRAADTTKKAQEKDTTAKKPAPQRPAPPTPGRPGVGVGPATQAPDSAIIKLFATRPVPTDKLVVRMGVPLKPSTKYFIRVSGATNLNGVRTDAVSVLAIPVPKKVPGDSTKVPAKAPSDTTKHQ